MLQKTHELIHEREMRGIKIMLLSKLLLLSLMLPIMLFSAHNPKEVQLMLALVLPIIIILSGGLWLIRQKRAVFAAGNISLLVDLVLVSALPIIWYNTVGSEPIPRSFLLKTFLPAIVYTMLVFNTITLRPYYPLAFSSGALLYYIILYVYAIQDPRTLVSNDFLKTYASNWVNPSLYFSNITLTLICGLTLAFIAARARKTIIASAEHEVQNNQLSRYFSPNVIDTITQEEALFQPGGTLQQVVVMFTDIRSFTNLSESQSPEAVLALLSEYHQFMVDIIFKYGGTLDKFIGDGIMATFGTPTPNHDDTSNAVSAAVAMRQALTEFNKTRKEQGQSPIQHGIGIHCGPAIVGNVGIENRLEYTVIGDTVNIASRIESECKRQNQDILISAAVQQCIKGKHHCNSIGLIQLRGKTEEIELFSIAK